MLSRLAQRTVDQLGAATNNECLKIITVRLGFAVVKMLPLFFNSLHGFALPAIG